MALTEMRERDLTGGGDDPVFRGRTGEPLDAHNIAKRFLKKAGNAIGCPWIHWHCFRHSAASLSEMDLAARQKFLGHTTAKMAAHYSHPELEKVRAQLERVN
jgi:integrase